MSESSELSVRIRACFESFDEAVGGTIRTWEAFAREMEQLLEAGMHLSGGMLPPRHVHTDWLRWLGFRIDDRTDSWVSPFFGVITWDDAVFRWR